MERADELAPLINAAVDAFYDNRVSEGVSAFQAKLLSTIKDRDLSEYRYSRPMKSGVHPDNREEAGLVPFDVHDLLSILYVKGWDDAECTKALACEIHSACADPRELASIALNPARCCEPPLANCAFVYKSASARSPRKLARQVSGFQTATRQESAPSMSVWRRGRVACFPRSRIRTTWKSRR